ncbi:MAG: GspE/PulE family protein [Kiritimatiellia bacterium]
MKKKENESPSGGVNAANVNNAEELRDAARKYGMTFVAEISADMLDASLVSDLPVEWARSHRLLPVRISGKKCVLTCNPEAVAEQQHLELLIGEQLEPVLAGTETVSRAIDRCYYSKEDSPGEFLRGIDGGEPEDGGADRAGASDLFRVAEEAPVTQLVNLILLEALKRRASDIHFEPFENRLRVRYRIDGVLYEQSPAPKHLEDALISRLKVMGRMDIAEKRLPQDGMARVRVGNREIDVRVSTVPVTEGERVVLRLLDVERALLPLGELGLGSETLAGLEGMLGTDNGIVVVCGPTGSGKTTTLYALLGQLDAGRKNIMTVEDPVEYQLPDIGQMQVRPKIGLTFSGGLRHILRQDPDVILVGETRDVETAEIAIRASLTGHLVFTTLHTNDAPRSVVRLVDMGVKPYLLASSLKAVLAQRLVRRLCPDCKREKVFSEEEAQGLGEFAPLLSGKRGWTAGSGCPECLEGYCGRTGLFEFMVPDQAVYEGIRKGDVDSVKIRQAARARGMKTLGEDGVEKVLAGITSLPEIQRAALA